jgi:hypothetical protein
MDSDLSQLIQSGIAFFVLIMWNRELQKDVIREREERQKSLDRLLEYVTGIPSKDENP